MEPATNGACSRRAQDHAPPPFLRQRAEALPQVGRGMLSRQTRQNQGGAACGGCSRPKPLQGAALKPLAALLSRARARTRINHKHAGPFCPPPGMACASAPRRARAHGGDGSSLGASPRNWRSWRVPGRDVRTGAGAGALRRMRRSADSSASDARTAGRGPPGREISALGREISTLRRPQSPKFHLPDPGGPEKCAVPERKKSPIPGRKRHSRSRLATLCTGNKMLFFNDSREKTGRFSTVSSGLHFSILGVLTPEGGLPYKPPIDDALPPPTGGRKTRLRRPSRLDCCEAAG
ncbi:hypothetical protein FHS53_002914 [Xanthobacter tagetidis]|nr:hypothetical protein [Xanthobacter tagetidis]